MITNRLNTNMFPKWITRRAITVYVVALLVCNLLFIRRMLPWYFLLAGLLSVFVFFYYGNNLVRQWARERLQSERRFEKKIMWTAFLFRLSWALLIYIIFQLNYGDEFGFENADAFYYHNLGVRFADAIKDGNFLENWKFVRDTSDLSDTGCGTYYAFIYLLSGNSILMVRVLKCLLSAFTCVLIFRLAKRNFGEDVARLAAIFVMLWPDFWYYCGTHLKETEMVFLSVLFVEQADQMLRTRNFSAWKVIPLLLISTALFTVRTPLALVSILALLFSIVMSSTRVVGWGKRILIGILALGLVGVTMGDRIQREAQDMWSQVSSGQQRTNMEWRAERSGGNKFAKYAGAAVFAPMIFTIPFPTMVDVPEQYHLKVMNGGFFIKNILSFFVIYVLFYLLFSGKWREHLLPLSFMLGYIVVLVMSTFAQSERFHQPAMPMELMFAAYGISLVLQGAPLAKGIGSRGKYKQWYGYWSIIMFVACIAWSWFKMAGRGL